MFGLEDDKVFKQFEEDELQDPSSRKVLQDRIIYMSCKVQQSKRSGAPILCDFGSAMLGDSGHIEIVQPQIYRAPEVILGVPWSYQVDIWNTGCMVSVLN